MYDPVIKQETITDLVERSASAPGRMMYDSGIEQVTGVADLVTRSASAPGRMMYDPGTEQNTSVTDFVTLVAKRPRA